MKENLNSKSPLERIVKENIRPIEHYSKMITEYNLNNAVPYPFTPEEEQLKQVTAIYDVIEQYREMGLSDEQIAEMVNPLF